MSGGHYILGGPDGRTPLLEHNLERWAWWFEVASRRDARRVAKTELPNGIFISTVFLGLDHSFARSGPPVLFETMSWVGADTEDYFDRYCTWAEAEAGHARIVQQALEAIEHAAAGLSQALTPVDTVEGGGR